jgi:hypothetical protein
MMRTKRAISLILLMPISISVMAGVKCTDLKYGSDNYQESMEELAREANLEDGYYNRYHEDVVGYLCAGKIEEVKALVDQGDVKSSEVEAIKELLGKEERSEKGQSYGYSKQKFLEMGLCSACADNVAQYYRFPVLLVDN